MRSCHTGFLVVDSCSACCYCTLSQRGIAESFWKYHFCLFVSTYPVFMWDTTTHFNVLHHRKSMGYLESTIENSTNHLPYDCLLRRLFRGRSKKTSKLRVTGLCEGNSPVTSKFLAQRTSNAENISIWWRHHVEMARYQPRTCIATLMQLAYVVFWTKYGIRNVRN